MTRLSSHGRAPRLEHSLRNRLLLALPFLLFVGCAHVSPSSEPPSRAHSLHTKGEFATYEYSGSQIGGTVKVHYTVEEVDGLHVRFRVETEREDETKMWIQELEDTAFNRDNNKIKAIYVMHQGEWKQLPNVNNSDLKTLYEWTLPQGTFKQAGKAFPYQSWMEVGGTRYPTRCMDVDGHLGLVPVTMHRCESDEFPWRHLEASIRAQATNELLWGVTLKSNGRLEQTEEPIR